MCIYGRLNLIKSVMALNEAVIVPITSLCQCGVLKEKLDSLLKTLNEESQASPIPHPGPPPTIAEEQETEGITLPLLSHHHSSPHTCSPRTNASPTSSAAATIFKPREQLMLRANSLKKAIRQIIEHTEKGERGFRDKSVRQTDLTKRQTGGMESGTERHTGILLRR